MGCKGHVVPADPDAMQMIQLLVTQGTLQPDGADVKIATGAISSKYRTVDLTAQRHSFLPSIFYPHRDPSI